MTVVSTAPSPKHTPLTLWRSPQWISGNTKFRSQRQVWQVSPKSRSQRVPSWLLGYVEALVKDITLGGGIEWGGSTSPHPWGAHRIEGGGARGGRAMADEWYIQILGYSQELQEHRPRLPELSLGHLGCITAPFWPSSPPYVTSVEPVSF